MDFQLFKAHFLLFIDLGEVVHTLVIELRVRKVKDFDWGEDRCKDVDWVWAKIVIRQVKVLKLDEWGVSESWESWEALVG